MCYCWCTNKLKTMNYRASQAWNKQTLQFITGRINIGREESVALSESTVPPRNIDPHGVMIACHLNLQTQNKQNSRFLPLTNIGLMKMLVRWGVASSVLLSSYLSVCLCCVHRTHVGKCMRVFLCGFLSFDPLSSLGSRLPPVFSSSSNCISCFHCFHGETHSSRNDILCF